MMESGNRSSVFFLFYRKSNSIWRLYLYRKKIINKVVNKHYKCICCFYNCKIRMHLWYTHKGCLPWGVSQSWMCFFVCPDVTDGQCLHSAFIILPSVATGTVYTRVQVDFLGREKEVPRSTSTYTLVIFPASWRKDVFGHFLHTTL